MAFDAYLRLKAQSQGDIKGTSTRAGRKGLIKVIAWSHEIVSPRDAASGLPTGKRQHKPLSLTKEIDAASPLLMNALVNNENFSDWELGLWQRSAGGKEIQHYSIHLTNASLASIRQEMPNNQYPENKPLREREHLTFCYQKIEWTSLPGAITAEDDWESPVA